ncbi:MAG: hypothetical protein ACOX8S_07355 [Christensenellales bacterium]|jgi:hypothetical protein
MKRYDKQFKEEAVRLSQEIGVRRSAEQLGLSYHSCPVGGESQRSMEKKPL